MEKQLEKPISDVTANLKRNAFERTLPELIEVSWGVDDPVDFLSALIETMIILNKEVREIGRLGVSEIGQSFDLDHGILNFLWPEQAKSYLILWRDIFFQNQKACLLHKEGRAQKEDFIKLKHQSQRLLLQATKEFTRFFDTEKSKIQKKGNESNVLESWYLQQNPMPVFDLQFEKIAEQNTYLKEQFETNLQNIGLFRSIETLIRSNVKKYTQKISDIDKTSSKVIEFLDGVNSGQSAAIQSYIEEKIEEINIQSRLGELLREIDEYLKKMPGYFQFPVETKGGTIRYREVNFQKAVRQYLDAKLLPLLYQVKEFSENTGNGLKLSLLSIKNRLLLLPNEYKKTDLPEESLTEPIHDFLTRSKIYLEEMNTLKKEIDFYMDKEFRVTCLYALDQMFLPVPLQSAIEQLGLSENQWFAGLREGAQNQWKRIAKIKDTVSREESMGNAEKIVRFVQNRAISEADHPYTSIFLAKGYIGESFYVGRKVEMERMNALIERWKQNYRGAVILSGQRFAGKTLFGELVVKRFIQSQVIRFSPNSSITVAGRRFETSADLAPSLEFIRKHTINEKVLVWIDDLELWKDPSVNFNQNIRTLCRFIDNYSRQIFFMVSMGNALKAYLEKIHDIDHIFQAEINLDKMRKEDIRKAILIRHGATQKLLTDRDGNELSKRHFQKLLDRIIKQTDNVIGESLMHWAFSTRLIGKEKVVCEPRYQYGLPDFLTSDNGILLSAIFLAKSTNEYALRQLFGLPFKEKYSGILQRLISVGLLIRSPDGALQVNDHVVNDLGRALEKEGYLKFQYKT